MLFQLSTVYDLGSPTLMSWTQMAYSFVYHAQNGTNIFCSSKMNP